MLMPEECRCVKGHEGMGGIQTQGKEQASWVQFTLHTRLLPIQGLLGQALDILTSQYPTGYMQALDILTSQYPTGYMQASPTPLAVTCKHLLHYMQASPTPLAFP